MPECNRIEALPLASSFRIAVGASKSQPWPKLRSRLNFASSEMMKMPLATKKHGRSFSNKTEKMPGFPESDVAQLTHEGNIVTWTLMKNEDGSFTQVILFALSDSDYFKV